MSDGSCLAPGPARRRPEPLTGDDDGGPAPLAVGWATVELDRAAAELAGLLVPGETFRDAPDSELLGASCRIGRAATSMIVLLEPSTEGRLAAALARHGEGWCATWTRDPATPADPASPDDEWSTMARPGPLGLERLERTAPGSRPFRLLARPATIRG